MAHNSAATATIECSDQPLDLSFHPSRSTLVAAGLVDGTVEVHDFSAIVKDSAPTSSKSNGKQVNDEDDEDEDDTIVSSSAVHTQRLVTDTSGSTAGDGNAQASCRAVRFSSDGISLWTGGSAGDVACLDAATVGTFETGKSSKSIFRYRIPEAAHKNAPIHVLHELSQRQLLVTGDDSGAVRVWDPRMLDNSTNRSAGSGSFPTSDRLPQGCVASWKEHDDYVSAIQNTPDNEETTILATSADGTLSVYDLRMAAAAAKQPRASQKVPGMVRRSDFQDDELLSLCLIKNGRKVLCGTTEGVLAIFSFGCWGDVSDRFPGHPSSIDAILKVDEDTVLTGSSDGFIRVVSIQPDMLIGVLGDNHEGFPIEKLQYSANQTHVGSVTHDNYIRLWDASVLREDDQDLDGCDVDEEHDVKQSPFSAASAKNTESDEEWEDMDEDLEDGGGDEDCDDDDSDSDSDEDLAGGDKKTSKNKKLAGRLKTSNERFFDDL